MGANGGSNAPVAWGATDQQLVDVGSIVGTRRQPGRAAPVRAARRRSTAAKGTLPAGSLNGAIALVAARPLPARRRRPRRRRRAGAVGIVFSDNRAGRGERAPGRASPSRAGSIANLDGDRLRAYMAAHGGRTTVRIGRSPLELETGRSGVITSFSSAGPTAFGHDLKPDISAPGGQILSVDAAEHERVALRGLRRHVDGNAARRRRRPRCCSQLHRSWTPAQVKSALVSTAGACLGRHRAHAGGAGHARGRRPRRAAARRRSRSSSRSPSSLSFEDLSVLHGAASRGLLVRLSDAGDGAGTWQVQLEPQAATAGHGRRRRRAASTSRRAARPISRSSRARARERRQARTTASSSCARAPSRDACRISSSSAIRSSPARRSCRSRRTQLGDTRTGVDRVETYRYPVAPFGNNPDQPPMHEDGAETVYVDLARPAGREHRRLGSRADARAR